VVSDERDFDECFRDHYPRLVRLLSPVGTDAADAVQEAFVAALVRWARISRYEDPVGWVRRVAIHRMLNETRRTRRRDAALVRAFERESVAPAVRDDELASAIRALPRQQRMAITLHYLGQRSVAEVAHDMGLSEGAVKHHLHAGRSKLRERLEVTRDA
jgi:RNA polymerase sigma-70 factor (ECF subfamily)